jgi:NAD(P)-dependent dehydrogenase (short-subunit alcohol dehydrogenase family)
METERHDVVIVTGAGGVGCGRSIAERFAKQGAAVLVSDIDDSGGAETVDLIQRAGGQAAFFRADVRDQLQVRDLIRFAESRFGPLKVLINNASAPHGSEELAEWMQALETDLLGTIHATRLAIDAMRRSGGGAIVNVASISALWHGRKTPGGLPGYDVAKAGMIRMTTRLSSLAREGIRVNCLAPGWIGTPSVREYWDSLTQAERSERHVPSHLLSPSQVADAVIRLANDQSLAGRVVIWWSENEPQLIKWGDRGYHELEAF